MLSHFSKTQDTDNYSELFFLPVKITTKWVVKTLKTVKCLPVIPIKNKLSNH